MLIAQVSDIHASLDNDNLSRFDRALEWLEHQSLDILVLTGDLIDDGWSEGYHLISERFGSENVPPVNDPPSLMIHRYAGNVLTSHHVSL